MDLLQHHRQMADYNQWSNRNLLDACQSLTAAQLSEDQGAFFKSILGSFNHLMVADLMWLRRFAQSPNLSVESQSILKNLDDFPDVSQLDQQVCGSLEQLEQGRTRLDQLIVEWVDSLDSAALDSTLSYKSSKGIPSNRPFGLVLSHFFNHQTHHRGQIGTLLYQQGIDPGVTDLLVRIPQANP